MPSEPSIPIKKFENRDKHTRDVLLGLLIDVVDDDIVAGGINHSLVIIVEQVALHVALQTEKHPKNKIS